MNQGIQKYESGSSAIVVFKQDDISHVSKDLRPYIEAKNSPILSQMSANIAKNKIKDLILTLYLVAGQNVGDDDKSLAAIAIMRDILYSDIKKKWPIATLDEITSALNSGIRGEFKKETGDLYGGPTIINCNIWIDCYFKGPKRAQAFIMLSTPRPSTIQENDETKKAAQQMAKKFCDTVRVAISGQLKREEEEKKAKKENLFNKPKTNEISIEQFWLHQFDKFHLRRSFYTDQATGKGLRLIFRYGQTLSVNDFMKRKAAQYQFVKTYLDERAKRK